MDEIERRKSEIYANAIAEFPYKRVVVRGEEALSTWRALKTAGQGIPVILGGDEVVVNLMTPFEPYAMKGEKSIPQILDAALRIKFPQDLVDKEKADDAAARKMLKDWAASPDSSLPTVIEARSPTGDASHTVSVPLSSGDHKIDIPVPGDRVLTPNETRAYLLREPEEPKIGDWPSKPPERIGLTVASDILSGKPLAKVHIALIPTNDWTAVPAYMRWGAWNDCPPPEYHVAAMRHWRDRYEIELVGMTSDTLNLRVARKPRTREDALALAREQYIYCRDLIDSGSQTYSMVAAELMASDWWFFWWD